MDTSLKATEPHYLLMVETGKDSNPGGWQFSLREVGGDSQYEVTDIEPGVSGQRLDLLTIIRALESLDQPSRVTLTSCSTYIRQGMQYGICEWRTNDWQWEFFGHMVPIKHADLWRRMEHLLNVHSVECRQMRIDAPHGSLAGPKAKQLSQTTHWATQVAAEIWLKCAARIMPTTLRHGIAAALQILLRRFIHLGSASKPCPGNG
ncbi:MAG TPA: RNase H family protein [Thermoguttaceae bacterium]